MILNPGRLNRRITFYRKQNITTPKGFSTVQDTPIYKCWAAIYPVKNIDNTSNSVIQNTDQIKFIIRYTKKINFDTNMTIKFKEKVYRIIGITDPYDDMESLEIIAESISRGTNSNDKTRGTK